MDAPSPLCLVIVRVLVPELVGKRITIEQGPALLGRGAQCDIVIPVRDVSREHVRFERCGGEWTVQDVGSTNGCRLNAGPLVGCVVLSVGDLLRVGHALLRVVPSDERTTRRVRRTGRSTGDTAPVTTPPTVR
jgi:pSer/pThr/pTyr-binding forkhead associated (FHA) protein